MTDRPDTRSRRDSTLSSVRNAARLLKEFESPDRQLGVTDMSRRLGISKSTAHRLLHTLAEEGLLAQDATSGAYHLSVEIFVLGAHVPDVVDVRAASIPILEQLRSTTRETAEVVVLDGWDLVTIERREGQSPRPRLDPIGQRAHPISSTAGIVLLAHLPASERGEVLSHATRLPASAPGSFGSLQTVLTQVRDQGWADSAHHVAAPAASSDAGLASVAAPVRNARGDVVAALTVIGPAHRLE